MRKLLNPCELSAIIYEETQQTAVHACKLACQNPTTENYMKAKYNAFKWAVLKGHFFNLYTTIACSEIASLLREYHAKTGKRPTHKNVDLLCKAVEIIESKILFANVVTLCQPFNKL